MLTVFRITAIVEGISFLALFAISMPLKYWADIREPNIYIGYIHGGLFILYTLVAIVFSTERKWSIKIMFWVIAAALLPFGTFYLEDQYLKPLAVQKT